MGNDCCKKRPKQSVKNQDLNSLNNGKKGELHLKGNFGQKNFNENDENNNNYIQQYEDIGKTNDTSSRKGLLKGQKIPEDNNNKKNFQINQKLKSKYENILYSYLLLHEKIKKEETNLHIYIVNKRDIQDIIGLYRQIIKNQKYQLNLKEKEKKEIIGKVVYDSMININELNQKLNLLSYDDCENGSIIDLVDKDFIEKIGDKIDKNKETKCIRYSCDSSKYIHLKYIKSENEIRIEERNEDFYVRKLLDNKNKDDFFIIDKIESIDSRIDDKLYKLNNKKNSEFLGMSKNNLDNNSNYNKDINLDNKTNSLKNIELSVGNKEEEIVNIVFMFLYLFKIQNEKIFFSPKENFDYFDNNACYYLINKNIIINLKNEIFKKTNENIILLMNKFLHKQNYEKFEEFFEKKEIIFEEFKKENNNLLNKKYNFKNITFKDLLADDKEIKNNINNNKIIYPSNFVLIKQEIYELLLKLISNFESNNQNENLSKYSILFCGKQVYLKAIDEEENIIYICDYLNNESEKENELDINIYVSYILIFNLRENFLNEYNLYIKNNDIYYYINKKQLKTNINETKKIINDNNVEIGFFINLKNKELIVENSHAEIGNNTDIIVQDYESNINNMIEDNENKDNIIEVNENKNNDMIEDNGNENIIIKIKKNRKRNIEDEGNKKDKVNENKNIDMIEVDNPKNDIIDNEINIENQNDIIENENENENKIVECDENKNDIIENENKNDEIENENKKNLIESHEDKNNITINSDEKENNKQDENNNNMIEEDKNTMIEENKNNIISQYKENKSNIENNNSENKNNIKETDKNSEKNSNKDLNKFNLITENSKIEEENDIIVVGLINPNINSYINSVLQCLYHIPQLTNYFISNYLSNFEREKNNDILDDNNNSLNKNGINENSLAYKYYEVIYHLYYKKKDSEIIKSYYPENFVKYILNSSDKFKSNESNDPHKLLLFILENLRKELNKKENIKLLNNAEEIKNIYSSVLDNNDDNSFSLYKKFLDDYKFKHNSIIDDYFLGIKSRIISCSKCNKINYFFAPFYFLNFSLSNIAKILDKGEKVTLDKCFEYKYNKQESEYTELCNYCNEKINGIYHNQIFLSPEILIIILNNVKENGNWFKLSLELNINNYLIEKNGKYKLIGIITYFKEIGMNEQYISYCKTEIDGNWYCCVDDCIYKVNNIEYDMEDKNRFPYILFFMDNKQKNEFN